MRGYPLVAGLLGVVLTAPGCFKREPPHHALDEAAVRAFIDQSDDAWRQRNPVRICSHRGRAR